MLEPSIKEPLNYIMPFGKYKGIAISKIPDNYIAWLLNNNIVKGNLRIQIESCIKEKYKDVWLDKALTKWIYNNYSRHSTSKNYPQVDFVIESDLYDAMDGCLPNQ